MSDLVLVRHGMTAFNVQGRVQGWIDPDLTDEGVEQALAAGRLLETTGLRPAGVWSSDLVRARRTAQLAWPDVSVWTDPRLRELRFGAWEGRSWDEIHSVEETALRMWWEDPVRVAPPGGETLAELRARIGAWAASVEDRTTDGPLVVVTHGGPLRLLLARFLGLPRVWSIESRIEVSPGGVVRLGRGR